MHLPFTTRVSRSTTLPVSLADVKKHLAIDWHDDDDRIQALIWVAVDYLENTYNLAIVSQQWTQTAPSLYPHRWSSEWLVGQSWPFLFPFIPFKGSAIRLLKYPVDTLDSMSYYDSTNTLQTFATSNMIFMQDFQYQSYVQLEPGVTVPTTFLRSDAWRITYTAGYTSTANSNQSVTTTCPQGIQHAIKVVVSSLNENRETEVVGASVAQIELGLRRLIAPYIVQGAI